MEDLKEALKHLDQDKSRDPEGFANELFKEDVAGVILLETMHKWVVYIQIIRWSKSLCVITEAQDVLRKFWIL